MKTVHGRNNVEDRKGPGGGIYEDQLVMVQEGVLGKRRVKKECWNITISLNLS